MASTDPAVDALATLLRQTPPGQVAKVYHDLRVLLDASAGPGASDQLRAAAWPVLSEYNTQQLITVKTPAPSDAPDAAPAQPLIIAAAGAITDGASPDGGLRFVDPRAQTAYAFDPLRLRLSDPQPIVVEDAYDQLRRALDAAAATYASHHYQDGVTSTFVQVTPQPQEAGPAESTDLPSEGDEAAAPIEGASPEQGVAPPAPVQDETADHEADPDAEPQEPSTTEAPADVRSGAEPAQEPSEKAGEDALLSDELEKTRLDAESAEQDAQMATEDKEEPEVTTAARAGAGSPAPEEPRASTGAPTFTLYIVGNRYNLANFWAGRWRSTYTLALPSAADAAAGQTGISIKVQGKVQVQVHYFEDGNVQLSAEHAPELPIATSVDVAAVLAGSAVPEAYTTLAEDVVRNIKADEQAYHAALEATLSELAERTFRALRRQLPVTKQKLDWNRAVSYNLASDLAR